MAASSLSHRRRNATNKGLFLFCTVVRGCFTVAAGGLYAIAEHFGCLIVPLSKWLASPFKRDWNLSVATLGVLFLLASFLNWLMAQKMATYLVANQTLERQLGCRRGQATRRGWLLHCLIVRNCFTIAAGAIYAGSEYLAREVLPQYAGAQYGRPILPLSKWLASPFEQDVNLSVSTLGVVFFTSLGLNWIMAMGIARYFVATVNLEALLGYVLDRRRD